MNRDDSNRMRLSANSREAHIDKKTPWSGDLSNKDIARPGGLLLAALVKCSQERSMQLGEMADELGVTYGYINQLRNGIRNVHQISDEFALACSRFLGIPRLTVLMLAGRITPDDLFEQDHMMATEVSTAMKFICDDMKWGHLITPELRAGSEHSKFAVVRLYEAATGKVLMDKSLQFEALANEIRGMMEHQLRLANAPSNLPSPSKRSKAN